ncbi:chemotaxis protein CheA [Hymenobacter sp. UV11]|uniref:chemotaxis protein CheA n=1 Tax=Hymenobacter sp. UV11 TaxID=1849735 RepID=UPI00105FBEBF|nr:chemotaxis protein CheA [Hymenobacter sp. UV11]TDN38542.1 chemotaxis protein CheA [Hymenobacter sp. UV11]TFZ65257.1 chemotaxis protein CheA [Hymenobacter sp. UV11]
MKSREQEYRELFMAEALEYYDAMSRHLSELERNPQDVAALNELFRLMHNLKANARAMGFVDMGEVAHKMETLFGQIRGQERAFTGTLVTLTFRAVDILGNMIRAVGAGQESVDDKALIENLERFIQGQEPIETQAKPTEEEAETDAARKLELSDLVYIPVKKLDKLLNLVGELVIDRDRILTLAAELNSPALRATAQHLFRISDDLQYSVMDVRLVGAGVLLNKFPRVVRDVAASEEKQVELTLAGQDVQIDRNVLQLITDALLHIVRNAVSHGLEGPDDRKAAGKPAIGQLSISALTERDDVLVQVQDDGRGINTEAVRKKAIRKGVVTAEAAALLDEEGVWALLFEPGFSMAEQITEISGRGVGLDVVKLAIDSLGGRLRVASELGKGTTFTLVLPTSIAVKGALLIELDARAYAVPLLHTDTVLALANDQIFAVGGMLMTRVQEENVPLVNLRQLLYAEGDEQLPRATRTELPTDGSRLQVLVVSYGNRRLGLIIDRFLRQQNIVVKSLSKPLDTIDLFGGVTLLGSGQLCLVLDVPALTRLFLAKRP